MIDLVFEIHITSINEKECVKKKKQITTIKRSKGEEQYTAKATTTK
jgi:hypothetical protein